MKEQDFWDALEKDPSPVNFLVFADWLVEFDIPGKAGLVHALKWCAGRGIYPRKIKSGWTWYDPESYQKKCHTLPKLLYACLPKDIIEPDWEDDYSSQKAQEWLLDVFDTLPEAINALAEALNSMLEIWRVSP